MKPIAVLGPKGTFSDCACTNYLNKKNIDRQPKYYPSIDDTFYALGDDCSIAIVPVENTLDGYVQKTLDLLLEMDVHIVNEVYIPVQFSMVANVQAASDIKRLYVQFKAQGQCRNFINSLEDKKIVTTESNVESFEIVEKGQEGDGAIVPIHMFPTSKAEFGIENITDSPNNYTRFLVVERFGKNSDVILDDDIKVSLYVMETGDRPGTLYEILREFSINHINLISIMSRPTKTNMGVYNFYLEASTKLSEKDIVLSTIETLSSSFTIKVLGIYSTI